MKIELARAMKEHIELTLLEIKDCYDEFNMGQKYAYVEMLELLQKSLSPSERAQIGLDYNIEEAYPLK